VTKSKYIFSYCTCTSFALFLLSLMAQIRYNIINYCNLSRHTQAPPKGQIVFDRLLKACNEVVWKNESIIVLDSIKVDPPYTHDDCKLLQPAGSGQQGSLDRVQKIVSSITS